MKKTFGYFCVLFSILFAVIETSKFGNNLFPQTKEEIVCDFIALSVFILGVVLTKK